MRRALLAFSFLAGCFDPDRAGVDPETTGETGTTNAPTTTDATLTSTTMGTSSTDPSASTTNPTTSATTSADTTTTEAGTSEDATTAVDTSTGTTGDASDCAGFDGQVVWLSFAGADLAMGIVDNAPFLQTSVVQQVGSWPAYTTGDEAEILEIVREHFAPYAICITDEMPGVPDYDLVLAQSVAYMGNPNTIGYATTDCNNAQNNNVRVVFLAEENNLPTVTKAIALSNQIAHSFGLDNVANAPDDLMNEFVATTLNGATFTSTCYPQGLSPMCNYEVGCGPGEQQSHAVLENVLGPA